ncbi:hypothetical protein FIBSPDRAFT_862888, partial [Athelia psychrophila]
MNYGPFGPNTTKLEGILTADDRSAVNSILTFDSDDQMAYITRVNGLIPAGVSFIAPSLGISAQCTSITQNCCDLENCQLPSNCTGYPEITFFTDYEEFAIHGDQWSSSAVQNPFEAFWQVNLPGPLGDYQFANLTGNGYMGTPYLVVACNFTVYDIFLHYTNGSYTLVNKTTTSGATAAFVTYPLYTDSDYMNHQMSDVFPILSRLQDDLVEMNPSAAEFAATFSPDVARLLLGFSAGVLQSAPATQVMEDGIVTRYPFIPLAIYLLSVYLYALLALGIFVWTASAGRRSAGTTGVKKQVEGYTLTSDVGSAPGGESLGEPQELVIKAQWHISQPSSLVAALFGGTHDHEGQGGHDADVDAWGDHVNEKRIAVGLHEQTEEDGSNKRLVYGVWEVQGFKEAND